MKLSEIPFDPEKGMEGLRMLQKSKNILEGSSIRFTVSRPDGDKHKLETFSFQPCHGRLQGSGIFDMCATGITKNCMNGMHKYFVEDSQFSRFILNRETVEKDGFICVTGDLWYPFQNCLNIFARQSTEGLGDVMQEQFDEFIKRGVPPLVALFIVTSTTMFKGSGPDTKNVSFRSSHSLVSSLSVEGVRNFFSGEAVGYVNNSSNKPTTNPASFYKGVLTWEKDLKTCPSVSQWLSVAFMKNKENILKGRGAKKSYSPFVNVEANNSYPAIRRNEFNEYALPFLLDIYDSVNHDRVATPGDADTRPSREAVLSASA